MDTKKIDRINELARKKKTAGISDAEKEELDILRREYIDGYKENLKIVLEHVMIQEEDGSRRPLKKKNQVSGN